MTINQEVMRIRDDESVRNVFIENHLPFIIGKVSQTTNRYIRKETDEEYIIGMEAFNEAINRFNPEKGMFLPFAERVIKSRIIDWMRREMRHTSHYVPSSDQEFVSSSNLEEEVLLKQEVESFTKVLDSFSIDIETLVDNSPKKFSTRRRITDVGMKASQNERIVKKMYKNKKLPIKDISLLTDVTLKIIKTHRNFIISVIVIFKEEFQLIGQFLWETEER